MFRPSIRAALVTPGPRLSEGIGVAFSRVDRHRIGVALATGPTVQFHVVGLRAFVDPVDRCSRRYIHLVGIEALPQVHTDLDRRPAPEVLVQAFVKVNGEVGLAHEVPELGGLLVHANDSAGGRVVFHLKVHHHQFQLLVRGYQPPMPYHLFRVDGGVAQLGRRFDGKDVDVQGPALKILPKIRRSVRAAGQSEGREEDGGQEDQFPFLHPGHHSFSAISFKQS